MRITRTTASGTSYASSFRRQPSRRTLEALDAIADAAVRQIREEKGEQWGLTPPQEPPASPADSGRLEMNPTHLPTRGDHGPDRETAISPEAE